MRLRRGGFIGWRVLFVLNAALAISSFGFLGIALRQGLTWRADFTMLYTGGLLVREGHGAQLYDLALQTRYQQQILSGKSFRDGLLPFNYPPYVALLIAPLTLMPLTVAYALWTGLQTGLLVWLMRRLWQLSDGWEYYERWLFLVTVLAFTPLLSTFLLGSLSLLLLVSWLECYVQLKSGREVCAAWWLALGALKPQSVLVLGLVVLAARRWRVLLTVAAIGTAIFIGTTWVLGLSTWPDFVAILVMVGRLYDKMGVVLGDMHNFKAVLAGLWGPENLPLINTLSIAAFMGVGGWTLWVWRGSWQPTAPVFDIRLAVTCALGLFFSLHLYPQDSLLWILPAFLGYAYLRECRLPRQAYALFLLHWPVVFLSDQIGSVRIGTIRLALFVLVTVLIWLWVLLGRHPDNGREALREHETYFS